MTYDSENGNQFVVHKEDGKHLIFKQSANGLFYHDLDNREFCIVETVDENKNTFQRELTKELWRPGSSIKSWGHQASRISKQLFKGI